MARTLSEIYAFAKTNRNKYLQLTEFENTSKMSIIDAFTWVTSSCIWAFENILDILRIDIAHDLQNRINGTPAYFANALLKYQSGDELIIDEEGGSFHYASINPDKQVIKKVSYSEISEKNYHDKILLLKIAKGVPGAYEQIEEKELHAIRSYLKQILFAGQKAIVVSRKGDVIIPRVTVYYDGAVEPDEVYENIENALNKYITELGFDERVYAQKIIDAIQSAEHVVDVGVLNPGSDTQGIFVAQYSDSDELIVSPSGNAEVKVDRYFVPNSGYLKQSEKSGKEAKLATWREAITLKIEE